MSRTYESEFKKKIVRLRLKEDRTIKSITEGVEYPSHAYPDGEMNSAKNVRPSRKPNLIMTI